MEIQQKQQINIVSINFLSLLSIIPFKSEIALYFALFMAIKWSK